MVKYLFGSFSEMFLEKNVREELVSCRRKRARMQFFHEEKMEGNTYEILDGSCVSVDIGLKLRRRPKRFARLFAWEFESCHT